MLDVTILKVYHAKESEAKKLRPYIEECHVFSQENALATKEKSQYIEDIWNSLLKAKNRTQAKKFAESTHQGQDYDSIAYGVKLYDMLYQTKCSLWHLERFSPDESKLLSRILDSVNLKHREMLYNLEQGNIINFIENVWVKNQRMYELIDLRDQHMGANLATAEKEIRTKYPQLKHEPLKYIIMIGALHCVEKYASLSINYINLDRHYDLEFHYTKINPSQTSLEEARSLFLAYGLRLIASGCKVRMTDQEILAMDETQLEKTIKDILRKN
ncbi:MAG: hypothetical protein Q8R37_00835 [Nanoarchaeota archaeon]|nr:hypothetical protein [Nanoarchaeota archaeon]